MFERLWDVALVLLKWVTNRRKDPYSSRPSLLARMQARRRHRAQMKVLVAEWPRFQAQIKGFLPFVADGHPRSARWLMRLLTSHDTAGTEVTSRYERVLVECIVGYLNRGLHYVNEGAKTTPTSISDAKRIICTFEYLAGGMRATQAELVMLSMPPDGPAYVDAPRSWKADFEHFFRQYRTFANDVNAKLGLDLFGTSASIPQ